MYILDGLSSCFGFKVEKEVIITDIENKHKDRFKYIDSNYNLPLVKCNSTTLFFIKSKTKV